ncbi:MAG: right-handed parallel beta-helix repeat-containing protein [Deltaproteobacteria bacterium]|nr:right-handed parallel beta-helix repeat-containing protein [Deltaproteobacteria bacterium]
MKTVSVFAALLLGLPFSVYSATLNVPSVHKTIQSAIDKAKPGDIIKVAGGVYRGNIKLKQDVVLQGEGASVTTINGDGRGSVIEGATGAIIEGFTIKGSGAKGTIGTTMDAGISGLHAPMTIANNRIIGNNTGIKLYYSPSNIINNVISDSKVHGLYLSYSDALVSNNLIYNNKSHGIYNSYAKPQIINNTIVANFKGIFSEVSRVVVKNNIIYKNTEAGISWAEFEGSQEGAEPLESYNLINSNGKDYSNVMPAPSDLNKDPMFVSEDKKDFHLKTGSSAVKAGENGVQMGAFGGEYTQTAMPVSPSRKSYASLKPDTGSIREPDYLAHGAWAGGTASGKGNFDGNCVPCHGPEGKGDGALAETFDPPPRDLSEVALLAERPDDFLFKVIKDGGASVGFTENMPPFGTILSEEEIKNIIAYIRSDICKCVFKEEGK